MNLACLHHITPVTALLFCSSGFWGVTTCEAAKIFLSAVSGDYWAIPQASRDPRSLRIWSLLVLNLCWLQCRDREKSISYYFFNMDAKESAMISLSILEKCVPSFAACRTRCCLQDWSRWPWLTSVLFSHPLPFWFVMSCIKCPCNLFLVPTPKFLRFSRMFLNPKNRSALIQPWSLWSIKNCFINLLHRANTSLSISMQ